jgi:hypothetical protein
MSDSKIQIKAGLIEFSGEGNQDWLAKQLDKLLDKIPELLKLDSGNHNSNTTTGNQVESGSSGKTVLSGLSVLNIAGKLNPKSGSDLASTAAAFLQLIQEKVSFTREDILSTMKKANGIYKDTYGKNLTPSLTSLEKNGHFLKTGNSYSLSSSKLKEIEAILSQ